MVKFRILRAELGLYSITTTVVIYWSVLEKTFRSFDTRNYQKNIRTSVYIYYK